MTTAEATHVRALWHGAIIAETDSPVVVEGNFYFPHDSVRWEHFEDSSTTTVCPWKGTASYYDVVVDGDRNADAAWTYPDPKPAADEIRGYVAFWHGVEVEELDV